MEKEYKKRILFIGMPDMAIVCLNKLVSKGINIVGVIPPEKKEPTHKLMVNTAESLGLEVIQYDVSLNEKEFLEKIKNKKVVEKYCLVTKFDNIFIFEVIK